ncbi:hypothetical protein WJ96_04695 [Burkholderia ubonensis]|uniref:Uncharacterized protein n=1 Tax=Burkholderia ubonensis TaxID=101571 RepID=A0AAW3N1J9_9BURK|nr:DUF5320 domain-containing protein [Burkholderia ubonensis]KVP65669.1 hypothetical protein WJ93_24425 [Burkholderia ubonensis]KVP96527.1 hypothetical protein WJ97_11620 [Burkholderia ubonensis]KVP97871.1 hypothetical protein WJ96_04695 [Burkholderia ubonensis]KVZ92568.1 hypothetical protein WL25_16350 [Burkholderia ubonensis]
MTEAATPQVGDTWYRYEDRRVGHADEWGDLVHVSVQVSHYTYTVTKVTPKGVWLSSGFGGSNRFVLLGARKRFAHPTKEEALESLMARKARQIRILEKQLEYARTARVMAESQLARLKPKTEQPADQAETLLDIG